MSSELNGNKERLGPAGRLAALFQGSAITPLLALVGLLLGLFAVLVTPRRRSRRSMSPSPMSIFLPGATPAEVESLVTTPAEQVVSQIKGIDTLYSFSPRWRPAGGGVQGRGEPRAGHRRSQQPARLQPRLAAARAGVGQPLVKPRGIDDVPIVSLTLWSKEWQNSQAPPS